MGLGDGKPEYQAGLHGRGRLTRWARGAIYGFEPLRRLVKSRFGSNVVYTLRVSRLAKRPLRFALGQLCGTGSEVVVLRDGMAVHVRRCSGDLVMLHQIIGKDVYALPAEVSERLSRLGRPPRIADLGANVGFFTMAMRRRYPGTMVLAIEADPGNAELFSRTIAANDLGEEIELIEAAASNRTGTVEFAAGNFFESRVAEPGSSDTIEVPLVDALPLLDGRDLLKIDIEGSEWAILFDQRFPRLDAVALALEWHTAGCPRPDARVAAEEALKAAGFEVRHDHSEPDCGTLWAWR